jgi:hypothetical protein
MVRGRRVYADAALSINASFCNRGGVRAAMEPITASERRITPFTLVRDRVQRAAFTAKLAL